MAITKPKDDRPDSPPGDDEAEESDEYEVVDEEEEYEDEDEDDEGEEGDKEGAGERGGGLTAMLLGSHANDDEDEDKGWVPDGGREPADYSGDEEDEAPEDVKVLTPEKPLSKSAVASQNTGDSVEKTNGGGQKRAREDVSEKHYNGKKVKV